MKIGKILGSISPAFGLLSGQGAFGSKAFGGLLGSMSPLYGAASGNGLFGALMQSLMGGGAGQAPQAAPPQQAPVQGLAAEGMDGNAYLEDLMRRMVGPR